MLVGAVYLVSGIAFGVLAGQAASHRMVVVWRLAAWAVSAAAFAAHIGYEHFRPRNPPRATALHAAVAVALGAFALAAAAYVHALLVGSGRLLLHTLALAAWPLVTALPAFVVALAAATGLGIIERRPAGLE